MEIKVGSLIRSYDFPHIEDSYMEGVVEKIEDGMIHCTCFMVVQKGVKLDRTELPDTFCTPEPGNAMFDDSFTRITEAGVAR